MSVSPSKTRTTPRFINPWRRYIGCFVPNWLMKRTEVSAQAKLLYGRLAQYAGQKGVAYPRQDTLATELGYSDPRSIRRYVKELRSHELIHVVDRRNKNIQNKYKFLDHPWQYEGEVIDDDNEDEEPQDRSVLCPPEPQDRSVLCPQDRSVLSLRESLRRESLSEENHSQASRPSGARRERARERPKPEPKTFSEPLGSKQEDRSGEDKRESSAKPAGRPKTYGQRMIEASEVVQAGIEKSRAQVSSNRKRALDRAQRNEQLAQNRKSEGVQTTLSRDLYKTWKSCMKDTRVAWSAKQWGQAKQLIDLYGLQIVQDAVHYVVENWETLGPRFFKRPGVPQIGTLLKFHDSLVVEAQTWAKHKATLTRWEEWNAQNPDDYYPPSELVAAYEQAKRELRVLGLEGS